MSDTTGMVTMFAKTKYATDKGAVTNPSRKNPSLSTYFAGAIRQVQAHFTEFRENIFFLSLFVRFFVCDDDAMCRLVLITYGIPRFLLNSTDRM